MLNVQKKNSIISGNEQLDGISTSPEGHKGYLSGKMAASVEGNMKLLGTISLPKDFMSCSFNPDGSLLAVALSNGVIKVFSTESKSCVYSISNESSELPATCLRWKPATDGQTYKNILTATYASGDVKQWHVSSGQCLWAMKEDRQVLTCSISSDASRLLTSGSDAKIHLYDATTRQHLSTFESRYDLSPFLSLSLSPTRPASCPSLLRSSKLKRTWAMKSSEPREMYRSFVENSEALGDRFRHQNRLRS